MINLQIKLNGADQVEKALNRLQKSAAKKIVRKGTREGAKVILKQARSNILSMLGGAKVHEKGVNTGKIYGGEAKRLSGSFAGLMQKALVVRAQRRQKKGIFGMNIAFAKKDVDKLTYYPKGSLSMIDSKKTIGKRSFIPAAIEYGHSVVWMGHKTSKRVAPIPFMRKAFDLTKSKSAQKIIDVMWAEIKKVAKQ